MSEWERENLQWHFIVHHQRWKDGRGRSQTVGKRVTNHPVTSAIYHSPHSPFLLYLPCTQSRHLWQASRQERTQTRTANHTLTRTSDPVAFLCPLRVRVGRSSGWRAAVSSVSGLIHSGKQCNSCTIPHSSSSHSFSFFIFLSTHPFPLLRSLSSSLLISCICVHNGLVSDICEDLSYRCPT